MPLESSIADQVCPFHPQGFLVVGLQVVRGGGRLGGSLFPGLATGGIARFVECCLAHRVVWFKGLDGDGGTTRVPGWWVSTAPHPTDSGVQSKQSLFFLINRSFFVESQDKSQKQDFVIFLVRGVSL